MKGDLMDMAAEALRSGDRFQVGDTWVTAQRVTIQSGRVVVIDADGKQRIFREGDTVITEED